MKRAAGLALVALILAACSQIDALAPVSGDDITGLRTAVYDVLLDEGVDLLVAPQCEEAGTGYTCSGTTIDKRAIVVTAEGGDSLVMTVTVGGEILYEGGVQDILQRFADVSP